MKLKIILIFFVCLILISCATSQTRIDKAREKDPRYQYNMGLFYLNSGQLDLSIKHLNESLSLEPQNHLALNALGLAHSMKGNLDESVKYFTECLKINSALSEAHNNLGSVYQEMNQLDKAEEHFIAASLDTQYSSRELPFYNLARLYFTQDKIRDALFQVQRSLNMKKDFPLALNLEGKIFSKLDQLDNAIRSFESALEINPDDIDLNFNLAEAYFNNNQFEKAKQIFNSLYPQTSDAEMKKKIESYLRKIK
ncbi:MAG: tetratricopeptide repeat protein [Candidatus Aminicenantes bacterium]|nr:tetratricopeptide repeat protein [Candidatus Aminicenantes bacterium]